MAKKKTKVNKLKVLTDFYFMKQYKTIPKFNDFCKEACSLINIKQSNVSYYYYKLIRYGCKFNIEKSYTKQQCKRRNILISKIKELKQVTYKKLFDILNDIYGCERTMERDVKFLKEQGKVKIKYIKNYKTIVNAIKEE